MILIILKVDNVFNVHAYYDYCVHVYTYTIVLGIAPVGHL